jgi:gliding motility-associated-like protein
MPTLNWAKHYGGINVDIPYVIKFTPDGGTIVAGYTDSKDGQVSPKPNRDYWDLWVVKLSSCGNVEWEKSIGGTGYESARDISPTADGGYIVLGETNSTDGDVVAGFGGTKDIWLIKLTAAGNITWQKRYGGSGLDIGNQLVITSDGSYLVAATSSSNDGNVTGNHSTGTFTDGVLLKIDANGALQWSKCFGGSKNDELLSIVLTNNKIFVAGYANSIDGDIPPSQKNYDVWLLSLDANANKIYSKIYGGSQNDVAYSMVLGADESLCMAGYTTSNDGNVNGAKGSQDYWVLNVNQNGNVNWQKVLGGTLADYANVIINDADKGYLVGGISYSNNGDVTTAKGKGDYWVAKLAANGNVVWTNSWGGNGADNLHCIIRKSSPEEYYFAGDSESPDGDFKNSFGDADFGIIKFKKPLKQLKDSVVCNTAGFNAVPDTLKDACGFDSVIVSYKPISLNGPFNNIKKADTIFAGQTIKLPYNGNGSVTWSAHPTLSCFNCANPVATPAATTVYFATNISAEGCQVMDSFKVVVLTDAIIKIPNAFTPNGDGKNDFFGPMGKVPEGYSLQVYNRFGDIVFKSSSLSNRWDGTYNGLAQPGGVFVYIVIYKDLQNKVHQQKGTFILIK